MKKSIFLVALLFIVLLCGCTQTNKNNSNNAELNTETTQYIVDVSYELPQNLSFDMSISDVQDLYGNSEYKIAPRFNKANKILYYNNKYLDLDCLLRLEFSEDKLFSISYAFESQNPNNTKNRIDDYLEETYGIDYYKYQNINTKVYLSSGETIENNSNKEIVYFTLSKFQVTASNQAGKINTSYVTSSLTSKTTSKVDNSLTYEWILNTSSTGVDWNSVNDTEKDVWCSNSIAAWKLMGYDIPSSVSTKHMKIYMDTFYSDGEYDNVSIVDTSEVYAIGMGIY